MRFEVEYLDNGWTKPIQMAAHLLETVDEAVDYLGEHNVYICTSYERHLSEQDNSDYIGNVACLELVDVSFWPESPGAIEQLLKLLKGIGLSNLN